MTWCIATGVLSHVIMPQNDKIRWLWSTYQQECINTYVRDNLFAVHIQHIPNSEYLKIGDALEESFVASLTEWLHNKSASLEDIACPMDLQEADSPKKVVFCIWYFNCMISFLSQAKGLWGHQVQAYLSLYDTQELLTELINSQKQNRVSDVELMFTVLNKCPSRRL